MGETPTDLLDVVGEMCRRWLAENFDAGGTMDHEEAWDAALTAVLPDDPTVVTRAAYEVLRLAEAGDTNAQNACAAMARHYSLDEEPDLEEWRSLVSVYLVNLRRDGLWDVTADLDPQLWDEVLEG